MDTDSAVRPAVEALTLRVDESLTITPGRGSRDSIRKISRSSARTSATCSRLPAGA